MQMTRMMLIALAACAMQACTSGTPAPETAAVTAENDPGAALLAPFKKNLKAALQSGMQTGVPDAVSVCKEQAPGIAASLSVDGVRMGRASHRRRNPGNTGPAWVSGPLQAYVDQRGDWQPVSIALPDGRRGYVEPIVMQPLCLACHGETLAPEVAAIISNEYPEDEATGFREGEFRGVFWVEYPDAG